MLMLMSILKVNNGNEEPLEEADEDLVDTVHSESVNAIITNAVLHSSKESKNVVQCFKRNERPISEFTQFSMAHPNLCFFYRQS